MLMYALYDAPRVSYSEMFLMEYLIEIMDIFLDENHNSLIVCGECESPRPRIIFNYVWAQSFGRLRNQAQFYTGEIITVWQIRKFILKNAI